VKIPLNFTDGVFAGGVNTSGSGFEGFDGKQGEGTWLAAANLKLVRSKDFKREYVDNANRSFGQKSTFTFRLRPQSSQPIQAKSGIGAIALQ
jgi:hypothetical protein